MHDQLQVSQLENLVQHLQDSRNGYKECAKNMGTELLENLLIRYSQKRGNMLEDLKKVINNPSLFTANGTLSGKIHQFYVNLKALLTGGDIDSIIREIKRGENQLIENYKQVLRTDLSFNLKTILLNQLQEIENDLVELDRFSC